MSVKIALIDIETAPSVGYVWGKYDQTVIAFEQDWYVLCFSVKWLGSDKVYCYSMEDMSSKELIQKLWEVFDEADVIIAHNGDDFDIKKSNAMFLLGNLEPPSFYKTIDTLKIARKYFRFDSNKLNDLGIYLGVGEKKPTTGFAIWKGCMEGDKASWKIMREYNIQDIHLLEAVYLRLRPWYNNHPNLNLYSGGHACPTCQSVKTQKRGLSYTKVQIRQRYHCNDCGSWWSGELVKR